MKHTEIKQELKTNASKIKVVKIILEIYHALEDKWYELLDKIDAHVPIYKVIDPIDKIFPSFVLFLLLLVLSFGLIIGLSQPTLKIKITDEKGIALENIEVRYILENGEEGQTYTNAEGIAEIKAKKAEIIIEAEGYQTIDKEIEENCEIQLKLKSALFKETQRKIILQNPDGSRIIGENFKIRISCADDAFSEIKEDNGQGIIEFVQPKECSLYAEIMEPEKYAGRKTALYKETTNWKISPIKREKGSLKIIAQDEDGKKIKGEIRADVMSKTEKIATKYLNNGYAVIRDIEEGSYTVSLIDEEGKYSSDYKRVDVEAHKTKEVLFNLTKQTVSNLSINIIDKETREAIEGAILQIYLDNNKIAEGSFHNYALKDRGNVKIIAIKQGYLYGRYDIREQELERNKQITIEMEKANEENSGIVKVKIVDEDNEILSEAKFWFADNEGAIIAGPFITDTNGEKTVRGLGKGNYYLIVQKGNIFAELKEQMFEINPLQKTEVNAKIEIGKTKLKLKMQDNTGNNLQGTITIIHNGKIKEYAVSGEKEIELKALGQAYAIFKSQQYADYYSLPVNLVPNKEIEIKAEMREINLNQPKILFKGFYNTENNKTEKLMPGQTYTAVFELDLPYGERYRENVFHLRIGDSFDVENEKAVITDYLAGGALGAKKGEKYTGDYETDSQSITERDAKWINIEWRELKAGIHKIGIKIKIKPSTSLGTMVPFYYRLSLNSRNITLPQSNNQQALYSATYKLIKTIGEGENCDKEFCYDSEYILDKEEELYIEKEEGLKVGNNYSFGFVITNNSQTNYERTSLIIESSCLSIDYNIINNNLETQGRAESEKEISLINFEKGTQLIFNSNIYVKGSEDCYFTAKIKADEQIVFEKQIDFPVVDTKQLELEIEDERIVSELEKTLKIQVKNAETKYPQKAKIYVKIIYDTGEEIFEEYETNSKGYAEIEIPSLPQNSIVEIKAVSYGFESETRRIRISDFVSLPQELKYEIEINTGEAKQYLRIDNLADCEIEIADIKTSDFETTMINKEAFIAQLSTFKKKIAEKGYLEYPLIVRLAPGAENIQRQERYAFNLEISIAKGGKIYEYQVPIEIEIKIGSAPDNEPCIITGLKKWEDASQGGKIMSRQFKITNSCAKGDSPLKLEKIRAKILWQSNIAGNIEISIGNEYGGRNVNLLNNRFVDLVEKVDKDEEYDAVLTFTPNNSQIGEDAQFSIVLEGILKTDNGDYEVQGETIDADLSVFDLEQCIETQKEINIPANSDYANLEMDFSKCKLKGDSQINIKLCFAETNSNSEFCPEEAGSEAKINIEPKNFAITKNQTNKIVKIGRERISGAYDIYVYAKPKNRNFWKKIKTIEATIEPEEEESFYLDKYKVFLIGEGSKDVLEVINKDVTCMANVKACKKAWKNAAKKMNESLMNGLSAGVSASIGIYALSKAGIALSTTVSVLSVVGIVVLAFALSFFGSSCDPITRELLAYSINLKEDSAKIYNDLANLNVWFNKNEIDMTNDLKKQIAPLVFENKGIEKSPSFAIITIAARKHNYGDHVYYGKNSNFGPLKVKDLTQTDVRQKIRVKVITKINEPELPAIMPGEDCVQGTLIGRTGEQALPKIKLKWSWQDIGINECDADNENYIYCDAVQFNIELVKKIEAIKEFVEKNAQNFVKCPKTAGDVKTILNQEINNGKIGVKEFKVERQGSTAKLRIKIDNKTDENENINAVITMIKPNLENAEKTEEWELIKGENNFEVNFENLEANERPYYFTISLSSSDSSMQEKVQTLEGKIGLLFDEGAECNIEKTTRNILGENGLLLYVNANKDRIEWTDKIPDYSSLEKMFDFEAYLIKDGFGQDFKQDFYKYYKENSFFDAPDYFIDEYEGLYKYYKNDKIEIKRKYIGDNVLETAGKYKVHLNIDFSEDWSLFDDFEPKSQIDITLYLVEFPKFKNIFYELPFDGQIGLDSENGRQNYGLEYINKKQPIMINSEINTKENNASNGLIKLKTEIKNNAIEINSLPSERGKILEIANKENEKELNIYPNLATPIILSAQAEEQDIPYFIAYSFRKGGTPLSQKENLLFWSGLGECYDFSGLPVKEVFNETADAKAEANDYGNWIKAYGLKWDKINKAGKIYLKTIVYAPKDSTYALVGLQNAEFWTPNSPSFSRTKELNGLTGIRNNAINNYIDTIEEVIDGIKERDICITSEPNKTKFFWNPKKLYESGEINIRDFENNIEDCIQADG